MGESDRSRDMDINHSLMFFDRLSGIVTRDTESRIVDQQFQVCLMPDLLFEACQGISPGEVGSDDFDMSSVGILKFSSQISKPTQPSRGDYKMITSCPKLPGIAATKT